MMQYIEPNDYDASVPREIMTWTGSLPLGAKNGIR